MQKANCKSKGKQKSEGSRGHWPQKAEKIEMLEREPQKKARREQWRYSISKHNSSPG